MNVTLITTTELSKILGISDRTIRKAITAGKIKAKKVGRKYEVFIPSLDKNIQEKIKDCINNNQEEQLIFDLDGKKFLLYMNLRCI